MALSTGKKRKRDSHVSFAVPEDIKVNIASDSAFTPILGMYFLWVSGNSLLTWVFEFGCSATTPGLQIARSTAFTAYTRPRISKKRKESKAVELEYLIYGENERVDYQGRELEEDTNLERHYVGIYDPITGELQIHEAPQVAVTREIKALRATDKEVAERRTDLGVKVGSKVDLETNSKRMKLMSALGNEFGSKKSKKAIQMKDRNEVKVEELDKDVTNAIVEQVEETTEAMPTREELEKTHNENRLIPPVHENVNSPEEVYDINDIVSPDELAIINIGKWLKDGKENGGKILVAGQSHVTSRINQLGLLKDPSPKNKRKLRILKYVAHLKDLYVFLAEKRDSEKLLSAGKNYEIGNRTQIPRELLESMLNRYTGIMGSIGLEKEKGTERQRRIASPSHLTKLLNYIAILCLMVEDNFGVDVYYLKDDLGLQTRNLLTAFRNVGCKKRDMMAIQADTFGIPKAEMKLHKIAYLTAKPEFPKAPTRRMAGRR